MPRKQQRADRRKMNDEFKGLRSVVREELERFAKTTLPKITQTEIEFALRRDARNIERCVQRELAREAVVFIKQEMPRASGFPDKFRLLEFALARVTVKGLYLEFGVFKGDTANFIAERLPPGEVVSGFDSFEGLPEDWREGYWKGAYKMEAQPAVRRNVRLVKGLFGDTLPAFARAQRDDVAFLHVDSDLYSSAATIFSQLGDRIIAGTVIVFDEFFNYSGWRQGEYKAFMEFVQARGAEFDYIGYSQGRDSEQVAVKITRTGSH